MLDYYQILGVSPSASHDEIVAAYRAKVRELHIGDNPIAELTPEQRAVEDAYMILYDETRRKQYDIQNGFYSDTEENALEENASLAEYVFILQLFIFFNVILPALFIMGIIACVGFIWAIVEVFAK